VRLATALPAAANDERLRDAARSLESMLLRQIIEASGAFKGGEGPGSGVRADLFSGALADAVARSGGIGLADEIARSLGASPASSPPLPAPAAPPASLSRAPVQGTLTSAFGPRADPITGDPALHRGVDLGAAEGTPILAPAPGVVRSAGERGGYGNAVEIDHGGGLVTLYGHASELLVSTGDRVAAGQEIARVGRTGRATGAHLHFEVRMAGRPVDPSRVLKTYAQRADVPARSGSYAGRLP
jgi:murein DD-endopeptidase MepM/ murein hydrolase activator NlpD